MVISLYNGKDVNAEPDLGLIQNLVSRGFVEGQYPPGKVKMNVVKADSVGEKFKNAVKKAKNAQYLNDADLVLVFQARKARPRRRNFRKRSPMPGTARRSRSPLRRRSRNPSRCRTSRNPRASSP